MLEEWDMLIEDEYELKVECDKYITYYLIRDNKKHHLVTCTAGAHIGIKELINIIKTKISILNFYHREENSNKLLIILEQIVIEG